MSKQKNELGKGLKALLSGIEKKYEPAKGESISKEASKAPTVQVPSSEKELPLSQILPNKSQPRQDFDESELKDLAQSIKTFGIIQPITVRKLETNKYEIISGERRYRASQLAGLKKVPVYIRTANDQELLEMALVENIQRSDLNAMEISISYNRLIEECSLTHEEMSSRIGKKRSTITNYLRLLKLPPSIQNSLKNKSISMGHARALAGIEDPSTQLEIFKQIIDKGLSVRGTEKMVSQYIAKPQKASINTETQATNYELKKIEDKLLDTLDCKTKIQRNTKGKGKIQIYFDDDEKLNEIIEKLGYFS